MSDEGNLVEVFDSIQGESLLVGCRQLFFRLGGCNLNCRYCDTPKARKPSPRCLVTVGKEERQLDNPVSAARALELATSLFRDYHHSLVITGGEPLLQGDFLERLIPPLCDRGIRIYLETNATLHDQVENMAPYLDWVAADVKLSSCTGEPAGFEDNLEFLEKCGGKVLMVKTVVTDEVDRGEFVEAVEMLSGVRRPFTLVIQPATATGPGITVDPHLLLEIQALALDSLGDVRIIPQVHPWLGIQ